MSVLRSLAVVSAIGGAVAAGLAGGVAAERTTVRSSRTRPDPVAREAFGSLPADRTRRVTADDGVELHVEEVGDPGAPLTVVFCHGYTLDMGSWHYQRRDLGDLGRLVFWDQRSHGRSGRSTVEHCTIDQLGSDLERVLAATAPRGPVVLVGHSMGGMTIMALADRRPDLFAAGGRVTGVTLISTSAGRLAEVTLGVPRLAGRVARAVVPRLWVGLGSRPTFVDARRQRGRGSDLAWSLTRRFSFGDPAVSPALVDLMERMIAATPTEVISAFAPAFLSHDKLAALRALESTSVLVLVGAADVLTPTRHAEAIAAALPDAESVVLPGAGHMVILERPQLVNLWLRTLVRRALERADAQGGPRRLILVPGPRRRWRSRAGPVAAPCSAEEPGRLAGIPSCVLAAALARLPVKSMGGEAPASLVLERRGVVGDRTWAVRTADSEELAQRLGALLGQPVTLTREGEVPHHDDSPVQVLTAQALEQVSARLGAPVDARRFRANVLLDGAGPQLHKGARLALGGSPEAGTDALALRLGDPMPRCVMVGMAQGRAGTGELVEDRRMLKALSGAAGPALGFMAWVEREGTMALGDTVRARPAR